MKTRLSILLSILAFASMAQADVCPRPWVCSLDEMDIPYAVMGVKKSARVKIRSGYLPHRGNFKGNILYFQGLGDSMLNHAPLFNKLSDNGYRVIAFDYMGQGGSGGSMNNTRINVIPRIGELIYRKWASQKSLVTIMGWSTGGLAAYMATNEYKIDRVILIAPGIVPNVIVGEGLSQWPLNKITLRSLTTADYNVASNPHVEKIRPESPASVMNFSFDLIGTSLEARRLIMDSGVKGFVLLSGLRDTYVNASRTSGVLRRNAPHFKVKVYPGALHEIDNERKEISDAAHKDILDFLK